MDLEQFDPAAGGAPVRACHQIHLAGRPFDDPHGPGMPARTFAAWLAPGWTGDPAEAWLARTAAGPAGWYVLRLPQRENRHRAMLAVEVHPDHRRQGLGRALLRHAVGRARQHGRTLLGGDAREGSAGSAFARAAGARSEITEVRRILQLNGKPQAELPALRAAAERAAAGYALRHWAGPAPAALMADMARLYADTADIPREEALEPEIWDPERVRLDEQRGLRMGLRKYTVAAVPPGGAGLAGLTTLAVDPPIPEWGFQELTVVARAHRGHRLGLLLKVAMLDLLQRREPQLARIITGNADRNRHMIAINTALGFTVLDRWPAWQLDLAAQPGPGRPAVAVTAG
jgi:GNAT superfamily N-acetyltransferase